MLKFLEVSKINTPICCKIRNSENRETLTQSRERESERGREREHVSAWPTDRI